MATRKSTHRDIDRILLLRRLKAILPVMAIAVVLAGIYVLRMADLSRERARVEGTVTGTNLGMAQNTTQRVYVYVHLDDGRDVVAKSPMHIAPAAGRHIRLSERVSPFGAVTYVVPDDTAP